MSNAEAAKQSAPAAVAGPAGAEEDGDDTSSGEYVTDSEEGDAGGAGDGQESETDEEEDEEEEEEPTLKYQRVGASVVELLKKDAASCIAVHSRFLALGTHWGVIHVLDFNGNEIKRFPAHQATVNDISIDGGGDYLASCADDGKIVVNGLYETADNMSTSFQRPLKSVALDPDYSRKKTHRVVAGGLAGQLTMNEKSWFQAKRYEIHAGEGTIHAVKWRGPFIAWANDYGVKIYDCSSQQRITYIDRGKNAPRPDLYRPNLCWKNNTTLLIGWANTVKVAVVREKPRSELQQGLPNRCVEIVALFRTEFLIAGIAPCGENDIVLLAYQRDEDDGTGRVPSAHRPELRIVTTTNEEISSDALSVHGFEAYQCNDYRLAYLSDEKIFYIVSPKDVVVAKPRDVDDHLTWLLERDKFSEALDAAEAQEKQLKDYTVAGIGQRWLAFLIDSAQYDLAAKVCPRVLGQNVELWEKWVFHFEKLQQLRAISPYIPINPPSARLSRTVYETVLNWFLRSDYAGFKATVCSWPPDLYNIHTIITTVEQRIEKDPQRSVLLKETLAELFAHDKQYDKSLSIYIRLRRGDVFALITKHQLYDSIQDKIDLLMEINTTQAVKMLVSHVDRIPIDQVVRQLNGKRELLHAYLHALFLSDPSAGADFHELQVGLYADFDPPRLMPFLRQSNFYPLEKALHECEKRDLIPEFVYLLGRAGNIKRALSLIISRMNDVTMAIEFAKEKNDEELWEDLLSYSLDKPDFIKGLLFNIGTHVDPIRLIKRIPHGLHIPGLRDALVKILQDYNLQMDLRDGCRKILAKDSVTLAQRQNAYLRRGVAVDDTAYCPICHGAIVNTTSTSSTDMVVVFFCHHAYHEHCLKRPNAAQQLTEAHGGGGGGPSSSSARKGRAMSVVSTASDAAISGGAFYCPLCRGAKSENKKKDTTSVRGMI